MTSCTDAATTSAARTTEYQQIPDGLPVWRLNVLRIGYAVMGVGLVLNRWPLLLEHASWELKEGTVICMLVAMSVLALLGLRHPERMLPILVFEVGWKLLWLALVALPQWLGGELDGAARVQAAAVLWVVVPMAVVPWRYVFARYVTAHAQPWRPPR